MPESLIASADKSWLQSYLDTGLPGHFAMLVFLVTIACVVVIFCRHLGLRYRLALVPLALMPLMSGIMGCSYDYLVNGLYHQEALLDEGPLQVLTLTSLQTGLLLFICIGLLLHKDAAGPSGS